MQHEVKHRKIGRTGRKHSGVLAPECPAVQLILAPMKEFF